jgi:23S rRNA A2030 N6-methylase RlmJ
MANWYFGEIGDVWKHVPLAEILAIDQPTGYWECHAGSASYRLSSSPDRNYGIYHLLDHMHHQSDLARSRYARLIDHLSTKDGRLGFFPGSPMLAFCILGKSADYVLCDTDRESVQSLREGAHALGVADRTDIVLDDGMTALAERAELLHPEQLHSTFVHIDPYSSFDAPGASGLSAFDLFCELSALGLRIVYWYGLEEADESGWLPRRAEGRLPSHVSLWWGELASLNKAPLLSEGNMFGCGIACANISREACDNVERLGQAVASIYRDAVLPSGLPGALAFTPGVR